MFSKFFINRPVFATVLSIIIVIAGLISIKVSPVEEYPQLTPPRISVKAIYNGADAKTISDTVATPLENAINGVDGMIYMQSTSSSSGSMDLNIFFKVGTDPKQALADVNNRIRVTEAKLPEEVKRIGISAFEASPNMLEVLTFFDPSHSMDSAEIYNYVNINVLDELKRVPGVGNAILVGNKEYAMRIWIKPDLLQKYGLTIPEVISSIREQNSQYATGKIGEQPMNANNPYVYTIKSEGKLKDVKQFENIILRSDNKGSMLKLKDIAEIKLGSDLYAFNGKINGNPTAPIMIFAQSGSNALAVVNAVDKKLKELSKDFPNKLTYNSPFDTTKFIVATMKEIVKTFIEAILLVIIVMYLFLGNFRATIIPMIAIPVSIIGAFAGMLAMGFSINMITLFALILAIGIVVDDAIIVIENVERNLENDPNISVKGASIKAMGEITAPVISSVLVIIAVFIPMAFMDGLVGVIQKQFALTIVVSVAISGFVALTLTPSLCATILKRERKEPWWVVKKFNKIFDISTNIFSSGVAKILRHIIPSMIAVAIMLYFVYILFKMIPLGLFPNEDKGVILVINNLPPATSITKTMQHGDNLYNIIKKDNSIKDVGVMAGYDIISSSLKENSSIMFITLKPWEYRKDKKESSFAIANKYNRIFYGNTDAMSFVVNPPPINGLSVTGGFEFYAQNLTGKNYAQIHDDMQKLVMRANKRPELVMVRTTLYTNFPEYDLSINKDKIKMLGINIGDIYTTINATIGAFYVNDFNYLGKTFKVKLRAESQYRDSETVFRNIFVKSRTTGDMIPISSLIKLKRSIGPDSVDRFNGLRAAKIIGNPAPGYTSAEAIEAIKKVFEDTLGGENYHIGWSGSSYQEVESTGTGKLAFIFGIIFVYLILAAQYERWLMPLAVLTAVPFSVFGALVAIYFAHVNNDVYFQIGLILLIGLGAKNAILIVEFAMKEHTKRGKDIFEASITAAKLRFRPIAMTSLAFTFGILPMVFSSGAGAASRFSLGSGVIGGMIAASTIAIFFVPMFYCILEKFNIWVRKDTKKVQIDENKKVNYVQ